MERMILHSDLNAFYASVETMLDPSLRGKAVAVCGSTEDRHGIVLAKSELAKKAGVKTGMVNWEAKQRCPDLIMVKPHYHQYLKYSRLVRDIYGRFTDQVEPYGMDECWLDVTGSQLLFGEGKEIAKQIQQATREELGLTVSIGVSFNKVFAKLGSDLKKPDAITVISSDEYKQMIWPLPASELLFVGRSTARKLQRYGINTIGDIAKSDPELLRAFLGINGYQLHQFANGLDRSPVMCTGFISEVKSIGHGITCNADLENEEEVWKVMLELSQDIGHKLRLHNLDATGVQITVKDNTLGYKQFQAPLPINTQSPFEISKKARELFQKNYRWHIPVRAVTVRAINLIEHTTQQQSSFFVDLRTVQRREKLEDAIEHVRGRYGKKSIYAATLMGNNKMAFTGSNEIIMPGMAGR